MKAQDAFNDFLSAIDTELNKVNDLQAQADTIPGLNKQITDLNATILQQTDAIARAGTDKAALQAQVDYMLQHIGGPVFGANLHVFTNNAYTSNWPQMSLDLQNAGFNAVRVDFHPDNTGLIDDIDTYNKLLSMCRGKFSILPMVSISGVASATLDACIAFGKTFADRYRFDTYEIGNELDNIAIKPGAGDGTTIEQYDPAKIKMYINCLKGVSAGLRIGNPGCRVIMDIAYTHWAFAQAMLDGGVVLDEISQHWYTNQEKNYPKTKLPIEKAVAGKFPNMGITFNEVGVTPQKDGTIKAADYPIFQNLLTRIKPFGLYVNELYNEPSRGLVEGNFGVYSKPGVPVPAMLAVIQAVAKL